MTQPSEGTIALLRQAHENLKSDYRDLKDEFYAFRKEQQTTNTANATQFAVLNLKAGAWGSIAGAITVIAALLLRLF